MKKIGQSYVKNTWSYYSMFIYKYFKSCLTSLLIRKANQWLTIHWLYWQIYWRLIISNAGENKQNGLSYSSDESAVTAIFWETELVASKIQICTYYIQHSHFIIKVWKEKFHCLTASSKILWSDNKWKHPKCPIIGEWQWLKKIIT